MKKKFIYKNIQKTSSLEHWDEDFTEQSYVSNPLVTVIVPNFNHEQWLEQRLETIYNQTYDNFEVILLDDCSTDNSIEILMNYHMTYKNKTRLVVNKKNTGRPFEQWFKGLSLAKGDLIWIAESDDWCELNFLEKMVESFCRRETVLAYCSTQFMQNGKKIWDIPQYLREFSLDFNSSFKISASNFVKNVMFCKNAIPNVSAAVFRKPDSLNDEIKSYISKFKLCGDWLFYLCIMKGSVIHYNTETTAFYRIHEKSTSKKIQKEKLYFFEQAKVFKYICENYKITNNHIKYKYLDLKEEYKTKFQESKHNQAKNFFDINKFSKVQKKRNRNIFMAAYALIVGGGEFVPIHLANGMKRNDTPVTLLNFNDVESLQEVEQQIQNDVPIINLNKASRHKFNEICKQLDIDAVHTHHGSVDFFVSNFCNKKNFSHLSTLHGFWESLNNAEHTIKIVGQILKTSYLCYTAEKNIKYLRELNFETKNIQKVSNGSPDININKLSKNDHGIAKEAFLLCHTSRALPTKGWKEAIKVVQHINETTKHLVQLIIIGEGEVYVELKNLKLENIFLLGNKYNLRDYYTLSDMAFFPSKYPGESLPMVNVEALMSNTPIIASNIGDIKLQLTNEDGEVAGELFDLENNDIPIEKVSSVICSFIESPEKLQKAKKIASKQKMKFHIDSIVQAYLKIYEIVIKKDKRL